MSGMRRHYKAARLCCTLVILSSAAFQVQSVEEEVVKDDTREVEMSETKFKIYEWYVEVFLSLQASFILTYSHFVNLLCLLFWLGVKFSTPLPFRS